MKVTLKTFSLIVIALCQCSQIMAEEVKDTLNDASEQTVKERKVSLTIGNTSDSELASRRAIDGEQPIQPLNINIGTRKLTLFGYAQTQYQLTNTPAFGEQAAKTSNEFNVTRVILMANAELTKKLSFFLMIDAASTQSSKHLHEYYAQYAFLPELKVRLGQFKQPFTLENIIAPTLLGTVNLNECTRYEAGIAGDPLQGNNVGRDMGLMITGEAFPAKDGHRLLNYSLGVFNGAGMNQKENNDQKDVIGMLNYLPRKNITLSTSFLLGTGHAIANDPYGRIAEGSDYSRKRWSVGTEIKQGPFMLRSEFMLGWNDHRRSRGFYAEVWYRIIPKLDIVADFDYLNKNCDLSRDEQATYAQYTETHNYLIGLQYWIYKACRLSTQYIYNDHRTGPDSHVWLTQMQIAF